MIRAAMTKERKGAISGGIADGIRNAGGVVESLPTALDVRDNEGGFFNSDKNAFINCVGITDSASPDEWNYDRANEIISTNLTAAISMTSDFVKATQGNGEHKTIIHVGSLWSRKHMTNGAVYAASKAGLAHYVTCIAYDLNRSYPGEFTVIGLHPGNVQDTPLTRSVQADLMEKRGFTHSEVKDLYKDCITTDELGATVLDLIGNSFLSGENIYLGNNDKR